MPSFILNLPDCHRNNHCSYNMRNFLELALGNQDQVAKSSLDNCRRFRRQFLGKEDFGEDSNVPSKLDSVMSKTNKQTKASDIKVVSESTFYCHVN